MILYVVAVVVVVAVAVVFCLFKIYFGTLGTTYLYTLLEITPRSNVRDL